MEIRKIVRQAARLRDETYLIEELEKLFKKNDIVGSFTRDLVEELKAKYQYLTERTAPTEDARAAHTIVRLSASHFAKTADGLNRELALKVGNAIKQDKTFMEIQNIAESIVGRKRFAARTIAETAVGAFDSAHSVIDAKKAGNGRFKYFGPPAERHFCVSMLEMSREGKTWTIEEINAMSNGQGLPVLYFRGGWNCRHRWVPVSDDKTFGMVGTGVDAIRQSPLVFAKNDLKQDTKKHAPDFGLSKSEYVNEAKNVVKTSEDIFWQTQKGVKQINFVGKRGYVVVDPDGTIRGYYHHNTENIEIAIKNLKEKKGWKRIK